MNVLGRQVLLQPVLKKESIIITSDKPELTNKAIVVQAGDDCGSTLKPDDLVIFNNRTGMPVTIGEVDYILTDVVNIYIVL